MQFKLGSLGWLRGIGVKLRADVPLALSRPIHIGRIEVFLSL